MKRVPQKRWLLSATTDRPEIASSEVGIVTPPGTDATVSALKRLLSDSNLQRKMGQNGRRLVEYTFTWEEVLNQYELVY